MSLAVLATTTHEDDYTTITSTSSTTSSSTSTSSTSSYIEKYDDLNYIAEEFLDAIGRQMPYSIRRDVEQDLSFTPYQYYVYALRQTACAPRPSWAYTMAIVRRLRKERVPAKTLLGELPY